MLGNDDDEEDDPLQAVLVSGPEHGSWCSAPTALSPTRRRRTSLGSTFNYQANDGNFDSTAAVAITSTAPPMPEAVSDHYTAYINGTLTVTAAQGVLANDRDPDNAPAHSGLTAMIQQAQHGMVTLNSDGSFVYQPETSAARIISLPWPAMARMYPKRP